LVQSKVSYVGGRGASSHGSRRIATRRCRALSIRAKLSASGVAASNASAESHDGFCQAAPSVLSLKACLAARSEGIKVESLFAMISSSLANAFIPEMSSCLLTSASIRCRRNSAKPDDDRADRWRAHELVSRPSRDLAPRDRHSQMLGKSHCILLASRASGDALPGVRGIAPEPANAGPTRLGFVVSLQPYLSEGAALRNRPFARHRGR
jgi:hypothetical protein